MRGKAFKSFAVFLAGALQTLALSPYDFWVASIGSLLLFLFLTKALDPKTPLTPRSAFFYGWLLGFGIFASGASWVYVSINTYGNAPHALAGFLTLLFVAGLGLFHGLMFWLYTHLRSQSIWFNALLFSAFWVGNDLFRSVFLTGFPWLFIGDSQLEGPLAGWLPIIGSYGATLILCATASSITSACHYKTQRAWITTLLVLLILWTPGIFLKQYQWTAPTGQTQDVALLQLNIPQEEKWKRSQRQKTITLLQEMSDQHSDKDVIFWPETALPLLYDSARPLLQQMGSIAEQNNASIVTGIPYRGFDAQTKDTVMHNSVIAIGNAQGIYHKQKLVPFGEYVPLQDVLRGLIAFFDLPMSDFRKGAQTQDLLTVNGFNVSPFICYEVVYPDFVARRSRNANYLLTISNDAWFGASIGPLQHLQLARIRATENGRYMVRATNNGVTAIIDNRGRITNQIPQFTQATLEGSVEIFEGQTPFTTLGSIPIQIFCAITALFSLFRRFNKKFATT